MGSRRCPAVHFLYWAGGRPLFVIDLYSPGFTFIAHLHSILSRLGLLCALRRCSLGRCKVTVLVLSCFHSSSSCSQTSATFAKLFTLPHPQYCPTLMCENRALKQKYTLSVALQDVCISQKQPRLILEWITILFITPHFPGVTIEHIMNNIWSADSLALAC